MADLGPTKLDTAFRIKGTWKFYELMRCSMENVARGANFGAVKYGDIVNEVERL